VSVRCHQQQLFDVRMTLLGGQHERHPRILAWEVRTWFSSTEYHFALWGIVAPVATSFRTSFAQSCITANVNAVRARSYIINKERQ
jgi:hypothetical protein